MCCRIATVKHAGNGKAVLWRRFTVSLISDNWQVRKTTDGYRLKQKRSHAEAQGNDKKTKPATEKI
jgi:hypothetical protein